MTSAKILLNQVILFGKKSVSKENIVKLRIIVKSEIVKLRIDYTW